MSTPTSIPGMDAATLAQALSTPQGMVATLQAAFALPDQNQKVALLRMAADTALENHPQLVPALIQQILPTLASDPSPTYREWLVSFVDDAVTHQGLDFNSRITVACQVVQPICDRLRDPAPVVIKAAVKAFGGLAVVFFEKAIIDPTFASTWQSMLQIRDIVLPYIVSDSTTEGVKLAILKFLQVLTLLLSHAPSSSPHRPNVNTSTFPSLSRVPPNHPTMRVQDLAAAGNAMVTGFVQIMVMPVNSAQIVTATISLLMELVKERPSFTTTVAKGLLSLVPSAQRDRANDKIGQTSILRTIKIALLGLVQSPHLERDVRNQVIQALEGLGARWHEIQHRPSIHTPIQPSRSAASTPPHLGSEQGSQPPSAAPTPPISHAQRQPQPPLAPAPAPVAASQANAVPAAAARDPLDYEKARQERLALSQAIQQTLPLTSLALPIVVELIVQSMQVVPRDEAVYAIERLEQTLRALPDDEPAGNGHDDEHVGQDVSKKRKRDEDDVTGKADGKDDDDDDDMIVPDDDDEEEDEDGSGSDDQGSVGNENAAKSSGTHKRRRALFNGTGSNKPDMDPMRVFRNLLAAEHKLSDDGHLLGATTPAGVHGGRKPLRTNTGRNDWVRKIMALLRSYPSDIADQCRQELSSWVLADIPGRADVALSWILQEWRADADVAHKWHLHLIDGVFEHPTKVDPKDTKLVRLIVDVPPPAKLKAAKTGSDMDVDDDQELDVLMVRIRAMCLHNKEADDGSSTSGTSGPLLIPLIRALKEFVDFSPIRRDAALEVLFGMAEHTNKLIRSPAVIALKKYFPDNAVLGPRVRDFAAGGLARLVADITPEQVRAAVLKDEKENADAAAAAAIAAAEAKVAGVGDGAPSDTKPAAPADSLDSIVLSRAGLMLALCSRDAALLSDILGAYAQLARVPEVQAVIRSQVTPLIRALVGQHLAEHPGELPPGLVDVMTSFPVGAESLALRIIVVLTECVSATTELVDAIKRLHDERQLGGKFLLPVLSYLDKEYILAHLAELVDLVDANEQSHKVFREAISRICGGDSPRIAPSEFIVALHEDHLGRGNRERIRKSIEAIQVCVSHTATFPALAFISTLASLLDTRPPNAWPKLLFRTAMTMYTTHKDTVVTPLKQLLHKAAVREVWTHPALLEGWMRLYILMLPHSLALALMLPPNVLVTLLDRAPEVREKLIAVIEAKGLQSQPRVIAVWPVLTGSGGEPGDDDTAAEQIAAESTETPVMEEEQQAAETEAAADAREEQDADVQAPENGEGGETRQGPGQAEQNDVDTSETVPAATRGDMDVDSSLSDLTSSSDALSSAPASLQGEADEDALSSN